MLQVDSARDLFRIGSNAKDPTGGEIRKARWRHLILLSGDWSFGPQDSIFSGPGNAADAVPDAYLKAGSD